jgi:catechol 2,3-dioxygenase-like lactoylglutathione lyase family enzyme
MVRPNDSKAPPVVHSLSAIPFLVPSYEEGLSFFCDTLGFEVVEDTDLGHNKRWIAVAPAGGRGAALILAVPGDQRQRARIGDQTGGRVGYFLLTNDFVTDYAALRRRGVRFLEEPRRERYGRVAVFVDPWGGKWDLLQPTNAT